MKEWDESAVDVWANWRAASVSSHSGVKPTCVLVPTTQGGLRQGREASLPPPAENTEDQRGDARGPWSQSREGQSQGLDLCLLAL